MSDTRIVDLTRRCKPLVFAFYSDVTTSTKVLCRAARIAETIIAGRPTYIKFTQAVNNDQIEVLILTDLLREENCRLTFFFKHQMNPEVTTFPPVRRSDALYARLSSFSFIEWPSHHLEVVTWGQRFDDSRASVRPQAERS